MHTAPLAPRPTGRRPQSFRRSLLPVGLLLLATGCAKCAPDRVGTGAARLTIRNVGTMVSMVSADTACGFASEAVLTSPTFTGEVGGEGSATWTVKNCTIDSGEGKELSKNCEDAFSTASGKFTISATRTVRGTLTGNPASPIIPGAPDAVTIEVQEATFENFKVVSSTSENKLTMISGSISATLSPRLAVSATSGACAIATPNTEFTDVRYGPSLIFVDTPSNQFEVDVETSSIEAFNGTSGDVSNHIGGTINVWGDEVEVPNDGQGLDPDFNLENFEKGYACATDLAQPVSYTCANLKPRLAGGAARLTVRTLGTIASLVDANATCGFSSNAVAGTPTFSGTLGKDDGAATFTITTACPITLPADTLLSTNCAGVETRAGGTVTVTGTKTVAGFRTGNPLRPIIPTSRDPAQFDLQITFTDFKVTSSASTAVLTVKSGGLSGKLAPRTALDSTTGACSISTPVASFSDLAWSDADVRLLTDGNTFALSLGASSLTAQNGTKDGVSNVINGTITVDGETHTIASEPLDTAFVQADFDAGFACIPNMVIPPVDAACSFRQPLGFAAARLLVKTFATSASILNGHNGCGFEAGAVLSAPTEVTGNPGEMGSITWATADCAIGPFPPDHLLSTNCVAKTSHVSGSLTASATKTVTGLRSNNPPIIPVTREAATLTFTDLSWDAFELYDLAAGQTAPTSRATLTGSGTVVVKPVAGESTQSPNPPIVYSIPTPIATIEALEMGSGTLIVRSDGNRFDLALTEVALDAFAGAYAGKSNRVSGALTVDGYPVTVPTLPLDPAFTQDDLNASYSCHPQLVEPVPAN